MEMPNGDCVVAGRSDVEVEKSARIRAAMQARRARLDRGEGFVARRIRRVVRPTVQDVADVADNSVRNVAASTDGSVNNAARRTARLTVLAGGAATVPVLASTVPIAVHHSMKRRYSHPNDKSTVVGKADGVQELPIPEWARANFAMSRPEFLSPLNIHASAGQIGEGYRKVAGKRVWPWQRSKVREGAEQMALGRTTLYQPLGYGRGY